jgi:hypothetical protein
MDKLEEEYRQYMAPFGDVKPDRLLVFHRGHAFGVATERNHIAPVIEAAVILLRRIDEEAKYMPMQLVPAVKRLQDRLRAYDAGLLEDEAQKGERCTICGKLWVA